MNVPRHRRDRTACAGCGASFAQRAGRRVSGPRRQTCVPRLAGRVTLFPAESPEQGRCSSALLSETRCVASAVTPVRAHRRQRELGVAEEMRVWGRTRTLALLWCSRVADGCPACSLCSYPVVDRPAVHGICEVVGAADDRPAALTCGCAEDPVQRQPPLASIRRPIRKPASTHELPDIRQSSSSCVGVALSRHAIVCIADARPVHGLCGLRFQPTRAARPGSPRRRDHLLAVALELQRA